MNVFIVEDEAPAARRLQRLAEALEPPLAVVGVADSVAGAVRWLEAHPAPDLAFFDIQIADGLSFEIFERTQVPCPVVFTTAYDEYALRAFRVNSIDYLLKPINAEALASSIEKLRALRTQAAPGAAPPDVAAVLAALREPRPAYKTRFLVKVGDQLKAVATDQIDFFTVENRTTMLYTREGRRYPVDRTLEEVAHALDPADFFPAHRQYVTHLSAIADVRTHFNGRLKVTLRDGRTVMVSRERAAEFKAWLDG